MTDQNTIEELCETKNFQTEPRRQKHLLMPRWLPLILALTVLLSACTQTLDMTFKHNESWRLESEFQYDEELLNLFGDMAGWAIGEGLGVPVPSVNVSDAIGLLEYTFELAKQQFAAQGIQFNWHRAQGRITFDFRGDSFVQFNQLAPGAFSIEEVGDGQYHLTMGFLTLGDIAPSLGDLETLTGGLFSNTVTLHVGKIISSNANLVRGGTATWYNPTQVDVVFTPVSSILPACLWGLGALVLIAGIVFIASRAGGRRCPMCGARVGKKAEICPNCGSSLYSSSF